MPELPEMEHYRRMLLDTAGRTIADVLVERPKSLNMPVDTFVREVKRRRIGAIERRAKHLLFHLESGNVLLLHLMLGGWMFYGTEQQKPQRTAQVVLSFGEEHLYFIGLRLGYLHLLSESEAAERLSQLGPEPLDAHFTEREFLQRMGAKRGMVKTALTDQQFISGIGNYYSDEICFHAGIAPPRKAETLAEAERSRLYGSIRAVLSEALQWGGYMEYPFFAGDELTGRYDSRCKVYDREGEPCFRCGRLIEKDEIGSRKTFFCANCQH